VRIAFLILAHEKPAQLGRLVASLSHLGVCFIHVDKKVASDPFLQHAPPCASTVYLPDTVSISWASFEMVEATLRLIRFALAHGSFDYFVNMSGLDYPIKSDRAIVDALSRGGEHIRCQDIPHPGHTFARLDDYFLAAKNRNNFFIRSLNVAFRFLPKRRWRQGVLAGMIASSGSQWWALSHRSIQHILAFVDRRPDYVQFFRRVRYADEMFFQIILRNSAFLADIRWTATFDDWTRPEPPYPAVFGPGDIELLRQQPHLFARKFDLDRDPGIFDLIDRELRFDTPSPNAE
jgi:hypothetical protein